MSYCSCGLSGGCYLCIPSIHRNPNTPAWFPTFPPATPKGWECPRCSRVYAPTAMECWSCNVLVNNGIQQKNNP